MSYSVYDILALAVARLYTAGMRHAVLCPGSRSAPLAMAFMRHGGVACHVLTDERSAGYTALGMAQATQTPVALVSTSGTAACNFMPAVAEAHFSRVPLLVMTADRPQQWLGQNDNQAIWQQNLYGRHVAYFATLPVDGQPYRHDNYLRRLLTEAWQATVRGQPVHLNVPIEEEALYEEAKTVTPHRLPLGLGTAHYGDAWEPVPAEPGEIIILGGMAPPNPGAAEWLEKLAELGVTVVADVASNLHGLEKSVKLHDLFLRNPGPVQFSAPPFLVTFGGPIVSKSAKNFLRGRSSENPHWHIGWESPAPDTFLRLEKTVHSRPEVFFERLYGQLSNKRAGGHNLWLDLELKTRQKTENALANPALPYSEVALVGRIFQKLPPGTVLHLGNSSPVRHAGLVASSISADAVYSNRGTSGIDGTVSTAAGHSMATPQKTHVLLCGDLAFLYDSNGLWNPALRNNLKIIVLNNGGGGIFRELRGCKEQPELESYFAAAHAYGCRHAALQYGCGYREAKAEEWQAALEWLFGNEGGCPQVLEFSLPKDPATQSFVNEVWGK